MPRLRQVRRSRVGEEMKDAVLFSKCNHLIPTKTLGFGSLCSWEARYDYCPDCVKEIELKQEKLQRDFDSTFGGVDGSKDSKEQNQG